MIWREKLFFGLFYVCMTPANQDILLVQVIGLLHQTVELPSNFLSSVEEISWHFKSKGKSYKVVHFDSLQEKFYSKQFDGRLKLLHNGTTLLIKDLRMEDSGNYTAQFVVKEEEDRFTHFMLMVYEPVPDPSIRIVLEERTSHWCNATLICSVPTNSSSLNYNWMYKHTNSVYELSGDTIHVSLNYSWDTEFQCTVHNPADQKNVSKQERCHAQDGVAVNRIWSTVLISLLPVLFILLLVIWKKRRKGSKMLVDGDQITHDSQHHGPSVEEEEHGQEQIQEADRFYCEPTFPTDNPTTQSFSWHKRDNHMDPPPQEFKSLYTSYQKK